ncbi:MIP family channel protein, partial [Sphingomonas sp.]|uniref:MIP family channel protein n=1 Tax=Sphingomonas sp. TaxID=28214 RepID=UPI003D6D992D
ALKPAQRPFKVFDSDGLFLLVQPSGALFWRFRYRKFGVERNLSLGSFPDVTLQQARKGCDKAQAQLIDDIDPAEEKRQRRLKAELAAQTTFKLVAEEFIQKMEREGKSPATIKKARWFLEPASSRARSHTSRHRDREASSERRDREGSNLLDDGARRYAGVQSTTQSRAVSGCVYNLTRNILTICPIFFANRSSLGRNAVSEAKRFRGELISECIAVFIIIVLGNSSAAMLILYDPSPYATSYFGLCIAWGLAVTIAIYVTGAVSGTHANPAVTLALVLFRGFSKRKALPYVAAQVVGAFLGAAVVYSMFHSVIDAYNATHGLTRAAGGAAGVFYTAPGPGISLLQAFWNEIVLTAILVLGIFAITEEFNTQAPMANSGALMIGLLVAAIGASAGNLEGWPINPARDFGPRLFGWMFGWGEAALPAAGSYWWVPIVGPLIGGVVGGGAYCLLIRPYLPRGSTRVTDPEPLP